MKETISVKKQKKETKVKKMDPAFLTHIKSLGFARSDAVVLCQNKDYWLGTKRDSTIYCVERDCDFKAQIGEGCLVEHCIEEHGWGAHACQFDNCKFVAYSKETGSSNF